MTEDTPITFATTLLDHNNKIWETQRVVREMQQSINSLTNEINKLLSDQHKKMQALEAKCFDLEQIIINKLGEPSSDKSSKDEDDEDVDSNEIM